MNNPWWTKRDQMDDRTRSLLKKIKRWKKWSRYLNNESDSKIQKGITSRYEEDFFSGKNEKMESPPKQETHRIDTDDVTKNKAMKDPNGNPTGRICQLKWEMRKMRRWMSMKLQEQKNSVPGNGAKKCWRCRLKWMIERWTINDKKYLKHRE